VTAFPRPGQLLTVAEYLALGEDEHQRYELQEGSLVMSPNRRGERVVHDDDAVPGQDRPDRAPLMDHR